MDENPDNPAKDIVKDKSPYKFDNPILLQIGKKQPLNEPELAQVDLIKGVMSGLIPSPMPNGA